MIAELLTADWQKAAEVLETLKVTALIRETPAEVLYRLMLSEKKTAVKSLSSNYAWTSKRSSDGKFVNVGHFDSDGVNVDNNQPDNHNANLGACLSRSVHKEPPGSFVFRLLIQPPIILPISSSAPSSSIYFL